MKKKLLIMALVVTSLTLGACGKNKDEGAAKATEQTTISSESTTAVETQTVEETSKEVRINTNEASISVEPREGDQDTGADAQESAQSDSEEETSISE